MMKVDSEPPEELAREIEKAESIRLREKLRKIEEWSRENGVEQSIDLEVYYNDGDLTSLTIEPEEDWYKEGELGLDRSHIILGPRGGVKQANIRMAMGPKRDLKKSPLSIWDAIEDAITGMS